MCPLQARGHDDEEVDDFLTSRAIEALGVLDKERNTLPDIVLVSGSGWIRIYSASDMRFLDEMKACAAKEGIQTLSTEESSTFVLTGDTAGCVKVWESQSSQSSGPRASSSCNTGIPVHRSCRTGQGERFASSSRGERMRVRSHMLSISLASKA